MVEDLMIPKFLKGNHMIYSNGNFIAFQIFMVYFSLIVPAENSQKILKQK